MQERTKIIIKIKKSEIQKKQRRDYMEEIIQSPKKDSNILKQAVKKMKDVITNIN